MVEARMKGESGYGKETGSIFFCDWHNSKDG